MKHVIRQHLHTVEPYASARRNTQRAQIVLNANELPCAQPYAVDASTLNRYPDFQCNELNRAYACYAGLNDEQIISHRGSDESIDLLIRTTCEPGQDKILICPPTYGMYAVSAELHNADIVRVPLTTADAQLDIPAIKANSAGVKLVFLCSPSNPLGNTLNPEDIREVIEFFAEQALVVIDEAYIEFSQDPSCAELLDEYKNLVITRTLSKAFGLAAIRVGFTLGPAWLIPQLARCLAPYPLPLLSTQIATQALTREYLATTEQYVIDVINERQRLYKQLQALPWVSKVWPSQTNFLLFKASNSDAVYAACQSAGILLRDQSSQPGLDNCLRVTVGSPEENDFLLACLKNIGVAP